MESQPQHSGLILKTFTHGLITMRDISPGIMLVCEKLKKILQKEVHDQENPNFLRIV